MMNSKDDDRLPVPASQHVEVVAPVVPAPNAFLEARIKELEGTADGQPVDTSILTLGTQVHKPTEIPDVGRLEAAAMVMFIVVLVWSGLLILLLIVRAG